MIVERSMHPDFLSNTYLVASGDGAQALFVDAGGPVKPLFDAAAAHGLEPVAVLLTHRHGDHVAELALIESRFPDVRVLGDPRETAELGLDVAPEAFADGVYAGLDVRGLPTPGHTAGMLSFLIDGHVFTGDTLFKGSVGGVMAPGHTTFEDLRASIMDTLMTLPPETVIHPGHTEPTTVADELERNPFVRIWRGLDPEGAAPCTAAGREATLILLADDYDGGHKAWVRWPDGSDAIVPGSRVQTV